MTIGVNNVPPGEFKTTWLFYFIKSTGSAYLPEDTFLLLQRNDYK